MPAVSSPTFKCAQLNLTAATSKIVPGATSWAVRNNADGANNIIITDAGAVTFRSTVGGITTLTATTLAGTLSTAAQPNVTSVGTLTSLTLGGAIALPDSVYHTMGGRKFAAGGTNINYLFTATSGLVIQNQADNATNATLTDAGALTLRSSLTVTANGLTVSSGTTAVQALTATTIANSGDISTTINTAATTRWTMNNTAGAGQIGLKFVRGGGTATDWEFYVPSGSADIRLYNLGDKFTFSSAGALTCVAGITATTGTFSGAVSLGNTVNAVSPTSPNRTVTIVIGGTTYYLAAKTTND